MKVDLRRKTKIVVTLGPATESPSILDRMIRAGISVARINFSHGDDAQHMTYIQAVQAVAAILLAVSAVLLWFFYPRGYLASRELWVDIHKWSGVALAALVFIHVILHWNWLVQMTRRYLVALLNTGRLGRNRLADHVPKGKPEGAGGGVEQDP